ncbi:hypothetical protein GGX14DRAFT_604008 [Mycena pura]|uniref:F-box domain-containing protein n=1 Tax=Mycena pura TaxID=153505 RepID=A0AAD6UMM4_9AGAR|nr:hypothetical protein GGX14DRAFT_604008 [Mycena pura]
MSSAAAPILYLAMFPSEIWLACWAVCSARQLRRLSLSVNTIDLTRGDWIANVHKLHRAAVRLERIADGSRVRMVRSWTFAANRNLVSQSRFYSHITNIGMVDAMYERVVAAFSSTLGRYQHLRSLIIRDLLIDRPFRNTLVSLPMLEELTLQNCDIRARDGVLLNLKKFSMSSPGTSKESLELVSPVRLQILRIDGRGDTIPLMTGFGAQRSSHLSQLFLDTIFDLNPFLHFLTQCPRLEGLSVGYFSHGSTSFPSHICPETVPLLQRIDAPLDFVRALTPNRPVRDVIVRCRPGYSESLSAEVLTLAVLDISNASVPVRSLALPSTYATLVSLNTMSSLLPGLTSLSMEIHCEERIMRKQRGCCFSNRKLWTPEVDTRVPDICDADAFNSLPPEEVSDTEEEQPSPAVHVTLKTHKTMPDSVLLHEILSWICSGLVSLPAEIEVLRFPVRSYFSESTELSEGHQHQVIAALSCMYPSLRELETGYHNNPHWERNGALWKRKKSTRRSRYRSKAQVLCSQRVRKALHLAPSTFPDGGASDAAALLVRAPTRHKAPHECHGFKPVLYSRVFWSPKAEPVPVLSAIRTDSIRGCQPTDAPVLADGIYSPRVPVVVKSGTCTRPIRGKRVLVSADAQPVDAGPRVHPWVGQLVRSFNTADTSDTGIPQSFS